MKILYFTNFYLPESFAPSFRAAENAKNWVKYGNDVVIYTGYPNHTLGRIFDGYTPKLISVERIDGIKVIRGKLIAKPSTSMVNRLVNTISFYGFGLINILFNGKRIGREYDIVLGTSPIIFTALLAKNYAYMHRLPFVFELRDLTHLQLVATGRKNSSKGVRLMKCLELYLCRKADKVVVVTEGFKKTLIEYGISSEKISIITNGVDIPEKINIGETEEFVLSYYGTIGISQNIGSTFEYANEINKILAGFHYRIIGEGAQKAQVVEDAKKYRFIDILPGMQIEDLEPYYGDTLLSVITLRKDASFKYTIPSKLFQIMGRGIAVLFIGPDGEAAEIIRKYNAGIVLVNDLNKDLADLRGFFSHSDWKEKLILMGNNGYRAVRENYSRKVLAKKYEKVLAEMINHG